MRRYLNPFPLEEREERYDRLDVTVKIETATGWIDLSDDVNYELHADTLGERSVTQRKQETQSAWVEGTFTAGVVREDVTETVAVYVLGETRADNARLRLQLEDAFSQISYRMMVRIEEVAEYWDCEAADYSISSPRELLHARRVIFKATVPRKPTVESVLASGDEL